MGIHLKRAALIGAVPAALAAAMLLSYAARPPVVVLTDTPFETLYGPLRARDRRFFASLALFRPVKTALVSSGASPEAAAEAVAAVSPGPYAALFPYRYRSAAAAYARLLPDVPIAVVKSASDNSAEDGPVGTVPVLYSDIGRDLYLAGRASAVLGRGRPGLPLLSGRIPAGDGYADFIRGLADGGDTRPPILDSEAPGRSSAAEPAVAVLLPFKEGRDPPQTIPLVLFTWADPSYAPANTELIFDDSVYGLLEDAVSHARRGGGESRSASRIWLTGTNRDLKRIFVPIMDK